MTVKMMLFVLLAIGIIGGGDAFGIGDTNPTPSWKQPRQFPYFPWSGLYSNPLLYYYPTPPNLNRPLFHSELGMTPSYHDLVFKYISKYGGSGMPMYENIEPTRPVEIDNDDAINCDVDDGEDEDDSSLEPSNDIIAMNLENSYMRGQDRFTPSDFVVLPDQTEDLYSKMNSIRTNRIDFGKRQTTFPVIGGVLSNYILLREHMNDKDFSSTPNSEDIVPLTRNQNPYNQMTSSFQPFTNLHPLFAGNGISLQNANQQVSFQKEGIKIQNGNQGLQTGGNADTVIEYIEEPVKEINENEGNQKYMYEVKREKRDVGRFMRSLYGKHIGSRNVDDGVVINAETPLESMISRIESNNNNKEEATTEETEQQPAVAQSKPSAIALAGPGGVAQASPIGTALVGPGGIAVASPSGTAVAGPGGQGAVQVAASDEKMKTDASKNPPNKKLQTLSNKYIQGGFSI